MSADNVRPIDVTAVHAEHATFVWSTLHRLGVRDADLEDQLQEVFVVVHRRLHTFDGKALLTTWLFGICLRVAAAYRRRAHIRREQLTDRIPEDPAPAAAASPEEAASLGQARRLLDALLDRLDLEKRAVFVMYEIDEMPCEEIARILGIPVGTVYSRLHAARRAFAAVLAQHRAGERR